MFFKKQKNAQILLKSQLSAQECWKCKIVLQIWKSVQRDRDRPRVGEVSFCRFCSDHNFRATNSESLSKNQYKRLPRRLPEIEWWV